MGAVSKDEHTGTDDTAGCPAEGGIKTMKLYHNVERVYNELAARGWGEALDLDEMGAVDRYDYTDDDTLDKAAHVLGLCKVEGDDRQRSLVDVGSGIGGPARYLAHTTGCRVLCVELQEDLHMVGSDLTARCNIASRVRHAHADFLDMEANDNAPELPADALTALLTFLHVPVAQRATLFRRCFEALRPGGRMYIEDYFDKSAPGDHFTPEEARTLKDYVYCQNLPTLAEYVANLRAAGFEVDFEEGKSVEGCDVDDRTAQWMKFTQSRFLTFTAAKERHTKVHGSETFEALDSFYSAIVSLFNGGRLGGVAILARKPLTSA
mmetsp:Transcript_32586/g.77313  ORF Transcript_32586/g.77313 Transcript_32586/m.77313 type:complete len:322 (-) Transcript_32586:138-1103(-)